MKKVMSKFWAFMLALFTVINCINYYPEQKVCAVTSADLSISQNGIAFIKECEGFSEYCYYDGAQSSIGYGTKCGTSAHSSKQHKITKEQAEKDMLSEINNQYIPNIRKQTSGIQMNQSQFDALVSFTYNTGGGTTMIKNSPLVKFLRGELSESDARSQFTNYVVTNSATGKVDQGLKNRRNKEANLFFSNPDPKPPSWASVSIPKQHFKIGEEVQFTLTSDTGNSYTVGIDDENGNRVYTHNTDVNLNSTTQYYTHVFDKGGNYSCYITTYNDYGLADSGRIYFTVYENKPGYAKVSLDRVSYKVGEDVTFKLESDTGNSYTVGIDDANGNRLYTKGTDVNLDSTTQYYTHIFDTAGQYSCFITTYNDMGHIDSKRIYFSIYDTKPGWAKVDINSKEHGGNVYKVGQNINFNLSSDTGFSYTVGIDIENDYGTRKRIDTKEVSIHESPIYTRSFDTAGNYSCYITTYNDYGLADSERIFFTIYDHKPDWAKVDINSKEHGGNVYKVGQNINFNLSSNTGFSYTVGIDIENDDGTRKRIDTKQVSINESPIYTRSFDTAGNYSCYITTYNDYGLADSERIFFTVYDHKPDWAKVTINSDMKNGSVYDVGENIHFNLTSNTGFSYTVGIDSENGERKRIDTQQIGIDDIHSYTRSFSEPGKYSCYITTYNDYGLADSERVYFIIAPKGDCNADGEFNISDIVLLQKWLLTEEKSMPNWKSADLCEDDRLDVFDLCLMKRMLVENS